MTKVPILKWEGCYEKAWNGLIVDDAFKHPAKYSRSLIERIYEHMEERDWIQPGDMIADPFGGVGLGGIIGAYRKYLWFGMEIEPRFVEIGNRNFQLHKRRWADALLGDACLVNGDSRQFAQGLKHLSAVVTSPPYCQSLRGMESNGIDATKLNAKNNHAGQNSMATSKEIYGKSPGQIARLREGKVDGVISSPPYAKTLSHGGGPDTKQELIEGGKSLQGIKEGYGKSKGQIETLRQGSVDAFISSPPYADIAAGQGGLNSKPAKKPGQQAGRSAASASQTADQKYGTAAGQIARLPKTDVDAVINVKGLTTIKSPSGIDECQQIGAKKQEGRIGNKKEMQRLNGTNTPVSIAGKEKICTSTTKKTQAKQEDAGTTRSEISPLFAAPATLADMQKPDPRNCTPANFAEGSSNLGGEKSCNAERTHAGKPTSTKRRKNAGKEEMVQDCAKGAEVQEGQDRQSTASPVKETYFEAVYQVYKSCFEALKPGGVIALVVKDYCKDKKRVPLCDDTARLLEHVGFVMLERVHATLVKESEHADLFEGTITKRTEKKSFFRRLHEKKPGAVRIDWEEVLFAQKPYETAFS